MDTVSQVRRRLGQDASPVSASGPVRSWRPIAIGGGFVAIVMIALLIGRGLRSPDPAPTRAEGTAPAPAPQSRTGPSAGRPPAPPPPLPAPTLPASAVGVRPAHDSAQLVEARQLISRGEGDRASALLSQLRLSEPDNPDVPYLQALVYFEGRRWSDGLAAAQQAVRKDPALKADPDLIKGAIRSLASDHGYERSQAFLRSLGSPATPFIREAAQRDGNPRVRERAADLLNGGGRGWPGRSSGSSGSSSGSVFKR